MTESTKELDYKKIQALNEKAIQNQFFTPDKIYIELGLLKDIPLGIMYFDNVGIRDDSDSFNTLQERVKETIREYQSRTYDTIDRYFSDLGYTDKYIEDMLRKTQYHDMYFLASPTTHFINTLIRHFIRNQNNSRPANKYIKKLVGEGKFKVDPIDIECIINTYPLNLSQKVITDVSEILGESLGTNIRFICKDPSTFDKNDWDEWLDKVDCFYVDDLGRFTCSPISLEKQEALEFTGKWLFARKRFDKTQERLFNKDEFDHQIQLITAELDIFFEFSWLQNNDVRLTEEAENVPVEDISDEPKE
jgi:hypothetical protein